MNPKLHILVVDDDRNMTRTLVDILEFNEYEGEQANSGREALEKVAAQSFDCVVTDVKMPDMSGAELFGKLRAIQPGLPVLFMTAYAADDLIQQGLDRGAIGVLNKPLDIQRLLSFLTSLDKEKAITIVDDDPDFCETLSNILEYRGFRTVKVTDPYTAVEEILAGAQIVLLDMRFDSITGLEVLAKIREQAPDVPVLLITGYRLEMADAIEEALDINVYACLYKPLVIPELLAILSKIRTARLKEIWGDAP